MKLFFSLICLIMLSDGSFAREIILISFNLHESKAKVVEGILTRKLSIPRELITLHWENNPCQKRTDSIMHICIDNKNEMQIISMNETVIQKSFQIFRKNSLEGGDQHDNAN